MSTQWQVGQRRRRGVSQANGLRLLYPLPRPGASAKMKEAADAPATVPTTPDHLYLMLGGPGNKHRPHTPSQRAQAAAMQRKRNHASWPWRLARANKAQQHLSCRRGSWARARRDKPSNVTPAHNNRPTVGAAVPIVSLATPSRMLGRPGKVVTQLQDPPPASC